GLAKVIIASDFHHIAIVFGHLIRVEVYQGTAHSVGMIAVVAAGTFTSALSAIAWVAVGAPSQVGVSFTPLVIMTLSFTSTNDAGSTPDDDAELADGEPVTGGAVGVGVHPDPRAATRTSTARTGERRRFRA
ncbi:MAG TPA: hypothetical protein PLL54_06160, partial [Dermatophilaceae bacterium]|nr:hypothetical protein [Dermatophilaceae bacterium]